MKLPHLILLILLILTNNSCSNKNNPIVNNSYIGLKAQKILDLKGTPQSVLDGKINTESSLIKYQNETFQIENDIVTTHFRAPEGDEQTLQFWKNKWNNQFEKKEVQGNGLGFQKQISDEIPLQEFRPLSIPDQKISIIYDASLDQVLRVVYYE